MMKIRRYVTITKLDETVLNQLNECILIGELKKVNEIRAKEVWIVCDFIGEL